MAGASIPVMQTFGRIRGLDAIATAHELLPLLKVRTLHAVLITLLIVAQYWFELASSLSNRPRLLVDVFLWLFAQNVMYWIVGFAIIAVLQTQLAPGRARTMVLISSLLIWVALWTLRSADSAHVVQLGLVSPAGYVRDGMWTTTTYLLLAAWYYESADRATRTAAVLRESELVRQSAERWLLELRLGILQARLDPQVLFDTLDEARRLYRSRPAAAEQLLNSLIDYLRLALPHLRQAESTLEREVALALAYARILRTHAGQPVELDSHVEPAVGNARFPPMVVQPLCEAVARSTLATGEPARLHISASRDTDGARLCIVAQTTRVLPQSERLAEIRRTLMAMFAPLVRMEAQITGPTAGMVSVLVRVPYVPAACADR
ncbi:MAG TPA: histidine kinase [Casimicrobiaceae bacterium]|jgi:sensor histidine kinase YesM